MWSLVQFDGGNEAVIAWHASSTWSIKVKTFRFLRFPGGPTRAVTGHANTSRTTSAHQPTQFTSFPALVRSALDAHTLDALPGRWAGANKAPDVIYCEPFYNDFATAIGTHGSCNHPPPLPMAYGEGFLKKVYEGLTSNPDKWSKTMLVICYDEHGGFFDHVAPPGMKYNPPVGNRWTRPEPFNTLGVRIPGMVVSPFVAKGACFSNLLDHTSIQQLMVERFGTPDDLAYFGDAVSRRNNRVVSLSQTLTADVPDGSVLKLPAAPILAGGWATSPALTELATLFRKAIAAFRGSK